MLGRYPHKWQYNGRASWSTIYSWCYEHIGPDGWASSWETLEFERESDLTAFLLRWA